MYICIYVYVCTSWSLRLSPPKDRWGLARPKRGHFEMSITYSDDPKDGSCARSSRCRLLERHQRQILLRPRRCVCVVA